MARETLPWAVRLPVLAQDGRDLLAHGDVRQAAGLAADVVGARRLGRLGRDGVEARLLLGRALVELGDLDQATTTYLTALEHCRAMHLPLRAADVLDGLAGVARTGTCRRPAPWRRPPSPCGHPGWRCAGATPPTTTSCPPDGTDGWIDGDDLSAQAVGLVTAAFNRPASAPPSVSTRSPPPSGLVAERVADGLTSRKIAESSSSRRAPSTRT